MNVISRLAHYPQPLLRSLLLNHQLVLKPGVPNLFNVSYRYVFNIGSYLAIMTETISLNALVIEWMYVILFPLNYSLSV